MKKLACSLFTLLVLLVSAGNSQAGATLEGSEINVTHDCAADSDVSISSASGTVTITGACNTIKIAGAANKIAIASAKKVAVTGSSNEVTIVEAGKIAVVGTSNIVTYQKGLGKAKSAKVSKQGVDNSVRKVKPAVTKPS